MDSALWGPSVVSSESIYIHERVAEQVRKNPDATAIISGEDQFSYKELASQADIICSLIRENSQAHRAFVGVSMSRSHRVVGTLLGIMQAGCAYVPLDPAYPVERLLDILEDTQAPIVFTEKKFAKLYKPSSARIICTDSKEDFNGPHVQSCCQDLNPIAYVIYTSGSTGKPKGVCCLHNGVTNLMSDFQNRQPIGPGDICSWWTSLNFDVSVYEIFSPLIDGACLVITPDSIRSSARELMDWMFKSNVSSAYIPPFMVADLQQWVRVNPGQSRLRRLLVGVEPIPERTLMSIHDMVPGLSIINGYGPTETTICATLYSIGSDNDIHDNTPIGKPVQNTYLRILDSEGKEVEPGNPGELFIGGMGVADGYLNRPKLNEERFIRDHFSEDREARLYKTGDNVIMLDDGNLQFLGRIDEQVKLRGFRIELGEIETQLRKIKGIREAIVTLRDDEKGGAILAAYLVAYEGNRLSLDIIMDSLKKYLPDYMIPSVFVRLGSVPYTPNGKTDRKSLPNPSPENLIRADRSEISGPFSPIESKLLSFFKNILKTDSVGIQDSFFTLGGHSLLALLLVSRIRETFSVDISLADVFKASSVNELTRLIQTAAPQLGTSELTPVVSGCGANEKGLSPSQMRLWYLDQLEPGSPAHNICLAYNLNGPLEVPSLFESVRKIVDRHPSLRTVFLKDGSEVIQEVLSQEQFSVQFEDLSHIPKSGRDTEARMLYLQESQRGFDLTRGPLFRCLLLRIEPDRHVLMFNMSHIISDGWSVGIIIKELMTFYAGFISGESPRLVPIEVQYTDYVNTQRDWMNSDCVKRQLNYWKQRFMTFLEPLNLPTDKPRPPVQSYRGACISISLNEGLCEQIRNLAARNEATVFMFLLAGFKTLLCRYTNQEDLCVGTVVANRGKKELETLVGFFINILALRTHVDQAKTFEALLQKVRDNTLDAYMNQDVPFEKVLEAVNPERSPSRTPLFQVMMIFQNMPLPSLKLPGLDCRQIELETFRSNFDLTCWVYEDEGRLRIALEYCTDLFEKPSMERLLGHLENILSQACDNPKRSISEFDCLGKEESSLILDVFSGANSLSVSPFQSVISRFEEQVSNSPQKQALLEIDENHAHVRETTYLELNSQAKVIRKLLHTKGIGRESNVAIMFDRNRFLISAILGILKAGAAYVPLDPKHPYERTRFVLDDAEVSLVLTDSANLPRLEEIVADEVLSQTIELMCIETLLAGEELDDYDQYELPALAPSQAAYTIYTSGSTGQPRGAVVEHGALASFTASGIELYGIGPDDRVLQFASPSFDASVEEIFLSLSTGAVLVLRTDSMLRSIPAFVVACNNLAITVLDLPTAFWSQLVSALSIGEIFAPKCLRLVIIGGEQVSYESVVTWMKLVGPKVRLFNTYGPTEATVVATAMDLSRQSDLLSIRKRVPIGKRLAHVKTYVLDRNSKPTPLGIPGELFLGGTGLSRGYVNLPEKTAQNFIPDPFGKQPGGRLYKTGDMVRYLEDGSLEFLGRNDRQIKIRGFRVELGEVESALESLEEVRQAIVVPWKNSADFDQLTAFIIPNLSFKIVEPELRSKLALSLPDFMTPSSFIAVEKFPITASGKIDFTALANLAISFEKSDENRVAPRNPIETTLTEIWGEVFKRDEVGVRDNFFDLGGHSLLSLQIIDKVNLAGLYLTPVQFLQNPTIEKQAQIITTSHPSSSQGSWGSLVELQPYGERPPLYFIHSTPGDVLGYVNVISKLGSGQPCYGFQSMGLRDPSKAHQTVEQMAQFYVSEMLRFQPNPPYCLVGWCYGGIVATEMALQLEAIGHKASALFLIETPFPKMKTGLIRYYFSRAANLLGMGPKGWSLYFRNKIKYRKRIKSGAMEKLFALELDHGPLANRSNVYRTNMNAIILYRISGFPKCPVRLLRGEELKEGYIPEGEALWFKTGIDVKLYSAPGNHLTILREPGANVVAQRLKEFVDELGNNPLA